MEGRWMDFEDPGHKRKSAWPEVGRRFSRPNPFAQIVWDAPGRVDSAGKNLKTFFQ